MTKKERQKLIRKLIKERDIQTQTELKEALEDLGCKATQATVSRDIRELNMVKVKKDGSGKMVYTIISQVITTNDSVLKQSIKDYVEHIDHAGNIVVIHTLIGNANALAAQIDERTLDGLMGTLAGTDTIVVFAKGEREAQDFKNMLLEYRGW
ncbi:MAG: arginine repressor [Lactobacillales bacterium]|jgi:transcriptional regulator of arginine metabolism|nr:arginine repressor [Lactobacillales bacterium]